jgi:16S rRNA (cytosine1402-N4)-methyltransferase
LSFAHQAVLLSEAVSFLKPGVGKVIVDGTLGGGGHAQALLERGATVIGIDRDPSAVAEAGRRLASFGPRFSAVLGNYADMEEVIRPFKVLPVDGVVLDLGASSPQLDDPARGFSFQTDGPLDMRMAQSGQTAAELIATVDERSLASLIWRYGEEPFSRRIARELKRATPQTTRQAVEAIQRAVPRRAWPKKIHVATRTFQALRLAVNQELEALERFLSSLPQLLRIGGVAAIISFHSLEDRRVKEGFRALEGRCTCPPDLPICACGAQGSFRILTRKAIQTSKEEVQSNPRARSARLRAVEKVR